ncbi:MAG TPA: glucose-6-phosphate dehydrogenase [Ignavibacteria bacterium]|nr:glucose-6-phosphate dehydrogenase [Ignavibacteria bacterium]HMR39556.1 glucose-6-phosphate dehydrogenase [Ignavibacteria bacterium]
MTTEEDKDRLEGITEKVKVPEACVMVIFGASGDLTRRMLIPDLYKVFSEKMLPENFTVLGFSRKDLDDESFRDSMKRSVIEFTNEENFNQELWDKFEKNIYYMSENYDDPDSYARLCDKLESFEKEKNIKGNRLFYLAVPPDSLSPILKNLALCGLNVNESKRSWTRIILEKPFGHDLESALKLNKKIRQYFTEDQIYRIDHYLGKESVQNILVTRFANGIFEPIWNRNYVEYVEVTSAESIGIENRGGYYDNAGALRDMVQNHLLQLVGYTAMEPPSSFDSKSIRDESLKVFQALRPINIEEVEKTVLRGQYTSSKIRGNASEGYREEKDVNKQSRTETFIAMKFFIDNWRWGGVPFYIRTGKKLPTRVTEIVIHFKPTPYRLFKSRHDIAESYNMLVIRIQPDEGILVKFAMKVPGTEFKVKNVNMDFHYSDLSNAPLPDAYGKLLVDCMLGDSTLFIREDAVEACWRFIQPILNAWKKYPDIKVYGYPGGSWGPDCADDLIAGRDFKWRYPCKNLSDDGNYCEL